MQTLPDPTMLAGFTLTRQHPITRSWTDDEARLVALAADHENEDLMLATNREVATLRRDRFAPGRPIEIMLNRWVAVSADLGAMMSMRYEGGDPSRPFVDASVLSRALTPADLPALAVAADSCFGELGPAYVRSWSAEAPDHFPAAGPDKRFLAAPLAELRGVPVPARLRLRAATDLAHYDDAAAAYAAVDARYPAHRRQAAVQSRADLAETLEQGLLFDVLVSDRWAGYVAATTPGRLGLPGFTVQELILTESARGAGLGRHLSTLLAQALPGDDTAILIGTIHLSNTAARAAALTAGRHDVGGWVTSALPPQR